MFRTLSSIAAWGVFLCLTNQALAQPPQLPEPLYAQDFEQGAGTWVTLGQGGKVSLETVPENVKQGMGALHYDYSIAAGQINLLVNPVTPPALATLRSIRFWVKANRQTSLAFTILEQGGGRYSSIFSVAKDQWQRVEIAPSELVLHIGKDDPQDTNGQLDLEKIGGIALLDFNQLFAQLAVGNNPLAGLLGVETGQRTLYLDDLVLSSKELSDLPVEPLVIDAFSHPQAAWFGVGGVTLKTVRDAQPQNNALQVTYTQDRGKLSAFAKLLSPGVLAGKTGLSLNIASKQRATLIVQLEEKSGGKYNSTLEIFGDTTPTPHSLDFLDFKPADDSKDDNNRFDPENVKQLLFIDVSGLLGTGTGENTLWLNQIRIK